MYTRERLQNPFRSRCEVVFGPLRGPTDGSGAVAPRSHAADGNLEG